MPQVTTDGTVLAMAPVKISSRETISVELLIDGESPTLRDPIQILTDVQIRPEPDGRPWWRVAVVRLAPALTVIVYLLITFPTGKKSGSASDFAVVVIFGLGASALWALWDFALSRRR